VESGLFKSVIIDQSLFIYQSINQSVFVFTCVMTPGLICRGWMAEACVTSGTVLSMRTENPAGLFGLGGRPVTRGMFIIVNYFHLV